MAIELLIQNGKKIYQPSVKGGITWETTRFGEPGILKFTCIQDGKLKITEGNKVQMKVDGNKVFLGFIFKKSGDKSNEIQVTAYDQLRYLKNKDTYAYKKKRADQVIKMIAQDFKLTTGTLANTKYVIPKALEDNQTLFDIIQNALDETLRNTKKLYVLYDNFGKIALKDTSKMLLNILIDADTGENYTYDSSIDGETYNQIKLTYDNEKTKKREVFMAKDSKNIGKWGVLQYYESVKTSEGAKAKANSLLKLYNAKTRNLSISNAFGDVRVRAGASVVVQLTLDDVKINNYMLVEKVTHTFDKDIHTMNLTLRGGDFVA